MSRRSLEELASGNINVYVGPLFTWVFYLNCKSFVHGSSNDSEEVPADQAFTVCLISTFE